MSGENEAKTLDYGVFLADLEAKRAALVQAIASIRSLMASGALAVSGAEMAPASNGGPLVSAYGGEIPVGAFLGKSIPDAAKLCLQIVRRKMTTREIADGLRKGGIESTGKTSFNGIVHSVLTRASKSNSGIVKFDRSHWGLVDWLPPGMRTTQGKADVRRTRKARSKRTKSATSTALSVAESTAKLEGTDDGHHPGKLSERAVGFLKAHPNEEFTAKQLSERFGIHHKVISMTLARPVKNGLIRMSAPGTYTAASH